MTEQANTTGHLVQRWALTLSYDGSRFYGWQKQAGDLPTVQTALEQALSSIAGEQINTIVAGRTDTGVHATAQVVHFDTSVGRPEQAWVRGVNAHLPDGVAVLLAQKVVPHFNARFDAYGRHYRYLLESSPVRSPLLVGRVGWTHLKLDLNLMRQAAALLEGEHDFSSFRAAECQAKSPVKTLYSTSISGTSRYLCLDLHGNAFLHHMVRNIMGALVYVGSGRISVDEFESVFHAKSRLMAPPTFMSDGLYLTGVDYPGEFGVTQLSLPEWMSVLGNDFQTA